MNRKIVAALAALVVLAVAVWLGFVRDRGDTAKAMPAQARSGKLEAHKTRPKTDDAAPTPQGMAPKWALDIDPEGPLRLEGQVLDGAGKGVEAAEVWLGSVPPRSAKTEGDGTFAFDKLVGREYSLSATAGELVGGPVEYKLTEQSDPIVIRLGIGAKLVVTVVDPDGKPIEGATVRLAAAEERTAETGKEGIATLTPVHPGWVAVQVTEPGFAPGNGFTQVGSAGATGTLKITLRKGSPVAGRVIDEAGKPVVKANITTSGIWDLPGGIDPVMTNGKGEFKIEALAPGSHTLLATDGEHAPATSSPITVGESPVSGVEIVMKAGGTVSGTVVDDVGKPVPFATVRVAGHGGNQMWQTASRQATSDKAGAFELHGLSRAKLQARAESDTAASPLVAFDLSQDAVKREVKLVLEIKGTIAGMVIDETGQPVPEVQVNAFPDILAGESSESFALAGMSSATTDGGGKFTIRGLPEGAYRVRAGRSAGGMQYDWGQQGTLAKTGDKAVKITLAAPGSIVGKIVMEGGSTPKLASLQLGYQPSSPANADGTFKLGEVTPGKYDLRVRGPEFAELVHRNVEIKAGKPTDVGTLTVVRGRKLVGKVVDGAGNAVAGAKVKSGEMLWSMQGAEDQMESFEEMSGNRSATTDQDGRFTLIGIAKKRTNIMADHTTRGRSHAAEIPEGIEDPPPITLTLRGYGSIKGKVTMKGKAVADVTITDTPKGGGVQIQMAQSGDDGAFTLTKVAEGPHVLSAMQQSGLGMSMKSTSVTVNVRAGKESTVTIDIPVGSITLAVQIKPQAGAKVDSAQVFLFRGTLAFNNAKDLTEGFLAGSVQGMKFWFGDGKPVPEFEELVPGDYSVCTIPITGDLNDSTFQQRLQEHMDALKVYCKQAKLPASPVKQTFVHQVPAMAPLPD